MLSARNIWTPTITRCTSGLGFANITGLSSRTLLVHGLSVPCARWWLYNTLCRLVDALSSAIPPIGGVIIADYLVNRRRYADFKYRALYPLTDCYSFLSRRASPPDIMFPAAPSTPHSAASSRCILLEPLFNRSLLNHQRSAMQNNNITIRRARLQGQ